MEGKPTDIRSADYHDRLKIAMEAYNKGCVIFSENTRKWYTPREFVDSDEKVIFKRVGLDNYSNFTNFYPAFAIKSKLEALHDAEQEFQDFMKKMLNAFELRPLDKKK